MIVRADFSSTSPPGGVFVNAEQVAGPTPRLDERYRDWHRTGSAALGTTPRSGRPPSSG